MTERANQAQIAKVAGVSRATVSFALNERLSSRLAPETRRRVLEAAERVDYRPNRQAQLMRGVKSGLIGIIKPAHMMQTGLELAYYAAQKIYQSDYELVAHELLWGNDDGLRRAINYMLDAKVEGLLLEGITGCLTEDEVARLSAENIPVVTLGSVQPFSIPAVVADYHEGMYDLTLHLLQSGHRDFTYLAAYDVTAKSESDEWSTIRERYAGFCAALATMPANAVTVRTVYEPPSIYPLDDCQPGYDAVRRLVAEKLVPKVLVCTNDSYAIGAMHACIEAGLHIPDEIAITGFDNVTVGLYLVVFNSCIHL